jgi:hypothetical protein
LGCGAATIGPGTSLPLRGRFAAPSSEPLMVGIATAEDGHPGLASLFFFNVEPTGTRCAPVDRTIEHGMMCTLRDCRSDDPGALPERRLDFGAVTVTAPRRHDAALRRDERGVYVIDGEIGQPWASGDALHIAIAGGADGPAASADLVVPGFPTLLAPPLPPPGEAMPLIRSSPLTVRWEPFDGIAFAFLSLAPAVDDWWLHHLELECVGEGLDGAMTIPPEILAHFTPQTDHVANFAFGARTLVDVTVGERRVRVLAETARSVDVEYE